MPPAKGDTKACTQSGCTGTMQFGRYGFRAQPGPGDAPPPPSNRNFGEERGWMCNKDQTHFRSAKFN